MATKVFSQKHFDDGSKVASSHMPPRSRFSILSLEPPQARSRLEAISQRRPLFHFALLLSRRLSTVRREKVTPPFSHFS